MEHLIYPALPILILFIAWTVLVCMIARTMSVSTPEPAGQAGRPGRMPPRPPPAPADDRLAHFIHAQREPFGIDEVMDALAIRPENRTHHLITLLGIELQHLGCRRAERRTDGQARRQWLPPTASTIRP